ncbi:oligosaccharide flippase family protein [uncultured Rikenella sp.]|uniref:oligosaccharide flippase family protein n=1 Tax=uncultured Rikenella sp. TaxID=368003 RepID=UPI00262944A2|nr:oligosaccharide flippase family protein [uncultured Rikenella sp.]
MSGFREILKHSGNYLIANLATRALAFISIPVYTRLLSTEDYGITAVFLATTGILNSLIALNFDASTSRYYYDKTTEEDFKTFVGTSILISVMVIGVTSSLICIFAPQMSVWTQLPIAVVYLLVPMAILNVVCSTFVQIYQPRKWSKPVALSSLTRVYLGFAFSITLILLLPSEKYLGQIWGQILAGTVMSIYWTKKIAPFVVWRFERRHLRYIFHYSIPLIPYALSGVIIEQFGKLTVASNDGMSQAGFYTLAISIASLTAIVTEITHMAWYPYYMEYMKSGNYEQHDCDLVRIFKLTCIAAMFFSCFGREIGLILAKKNFTSALNLVPILTIGYVCHQLSYAYMRNISFVLKTGYMSVIVISSGCANVLLNSIMIPRWGTLGAAIAVALSYVLMASLSWFCSVRIIKVRGIPLLKLLKPLAILLLFQVQLYWIFMVENLWSSLGLKIVLFIMLGVILFRNDRQAILNIMQRFINR